MSPKNKNPLTPDSMLKEQAIQEAVRMFRLHEQPERMSIFTLLDHWKPFAVGAVAASLALIFVMQFTHDSGSVQTASNEAVILSEMQQLFGNQLEGVVQIGSNIQPVVSQSASFTKAQPIVISLRVGDKEIRVITYSGNTIGLNIGGKTINLSPTVTDDGKVIVEGSDFVWSNGKSTGNAPVSITAKPMGVSL